MKDLYSLWPYFLSSEKLVFYNSFSPLKLLNFKGFRSFLVQTITLLSPISKLLCLKHKYQAFFHYFNSFCAKYFFPSHFLSGTQIWNEDISQKSVSLYRHLPSRSYLISFSKKHSQHYLGFLYTLKILETF